MILGKASRTIVMMQDVEAATARVVDAGKFEVGLRSQTEFSIFVPVDCGKFDSIPNKSFIKI